MKQRLGSPITPQCELFSRLEEVEDKLELAIDGMESAVSWFSMLLELCRDGFDPEIYDEGLAGAYERLSQLRPHKCVPWFYESPGEVPTENEND